MYYDEFDSEFLESCDESLRELDRMNNSMQKQTRAFIDKMMNRWGKELKLGTDVFCAVFNPSTSLGRCG